MMACHCTAKLSAQINTRGGEQKIEKNCGKEEEEEEEEEEEGEEDNFLDKIKEVKKAEVLKGRFCFLDCVCGRYICTYVRLK